MNQTLPEARPRIINHVCARALILIVTIVSFAVLAAPARCADAGGKPLDAEFLRGFVAGDYDLIGRKPDSAITYTGRITLREKGDKLQVTRTIGGKTGKGTARFDTVAGADRIPVVRMHFSLEGVEYDAIYRWQSDPDNYPRFTGIISLPGKRTKSPGLEALFPIHK